MSSYSNRTLCSVWDLAHFTALNRMSIPEIEKRFGVSRATAERWLSVAIELGVEIAEVPTPTGIAYRTLSQVQAYEVLDIEFRTRAKSRRERRNARQRERRREKAEA